MKSFSSSGVLTMTGVGAMSVLVVIGCVSSSSAPDGGGLDASIPLEDSGAADAAAAPDATVDGGADSGRVAEAGDDAGAPCEGVCLVASGQAFPYCVAVDPTNVYWTDHGSTATNGSLVRIPVAGGSPVTLVSGRGQPTGIAVDSANVYWADNGQCPDDGGPCTGAVMRVPLDGGVPTELAVDLAYLIAVDATGVYWTNPTNGTVMTAPLDGGAPTALASGQDVPQGIAVNDTSVYWTNFGAFVAGAGTVMRVPKGGGTPSVVASGQNQPFGIAADATGVYWADNGTRSCPDDGGACAYDGGAVMSAPLDGGAPTVLAAAQNLPAWLTADATNVYWEDEKNSAVMGVPKGGGTPVTLASGQLQPGGLAAGAASLYWEDFGSCDDAGACTGSVVKVSPP